MLKVRNELPKNEYPDVTENSVTFSPIDADWMAYTVDYCGVGNEHSLDINHLRRVGSIRVVKEFALGDGITANRVYLGEIVYNEEDDSIDFVPVQGTPQFEVVGSHTLHAEALALIDRMNFEA